MAVETLAKTPFISIVLFLPMLGALFLAFIPRKNTKAIRNFAFIASLATFLVSLSLWVNFDAGLAGFQMVETHKWIPALGANYIVGIDGISLLLVIMTTFLSPITIIGAFSAITNREKEFYIAMLFLETAMLGALFSLDLVLFYVFWEFMLLPMYLMIGIWGSKNRIYATTKFFLYTFFGSIFMLVAIIYLYSKTGWTSFAYTDMLNLHLTVKEQLYLFAAFALAFAVKVPMFPFHTWLPDAHTEAPTPGSVILAGVMLKLGTYGFIRFAIPLFPDATGTFAIPIMTLAVIGVVWGSLMAWYQKDMKRLVAYSSVAHLGIVMLGMFAFTMEGMQGSLLQMVNHGISTGGLFLLVGIIYERRHTRLISEFGGIGRVMKVYVAFFTIVTLSSIGLPGTNGFIGEFLVLFGTFKAALASPAFMTTGIILGVFAATGVILGAVYMLSLIRKVFYGPVTNPKNKNLKDMNLREILILTTLVIVIFWIGIFPNFFLNKSKASMQHMITSYQSRVIRYRDAGHKKSSSIAIREESK